MATPEPIGTIICRRGALRARCRFCNREHTLLCDFPVRKGEKVGTCDAKLCPDHAVRIDANTDYCKFHQTTLPVRELLEVLMKN